MGSSINYGFLLHLLDGPKFSKFTSFPRILQSFAIAVTFIILSPDAITTFTPAEWHFTTVSLNPFLKKYLILTHVINIHPNLCILNPSELRYFWKFSYSFSEISL